MDTLTHRVYECAHTRAAVREAVPQWFWEEAARRAAGDRFWTLGACPNPSDLAPQPPTALDVHVEYKDEGYRGRDGAELIAIGDRAYVDGSCTTPTVKGLARASCAVVQTDEAGRPIKVLQAAVPRHLPQTAQSAEYLGIAIAINAIRRATVVVGDCLNVVRAMNGEGRTPFAATRMYAGLLLSTRADPERRRMAGVIQWTRAHRQIVGDETPEVLRDIKGNEEADVAAKDALHIPPPSGTTPGPSWSTTTGEYHMLSRRSSRL